MKRTYIFFICTLISLSISSQKIQKDKSPKKAAIYSAVIPGAGQIYTKKYWKVPIIYGGLVTSAYFINDNNNQYKEYREAALLSYETGEDQLGYTYSELITLKDHYKRNREISYFSFVGVYILNIIDASVNAHLFHFDVSDDISLNIRPYSTFSNTGVSFSLNL
ncbi:MAG: hypothetical protein HOA49_01705 [Flavobacteriales bacterium]|jgi:hypothetical protein|nr:hypothetical protein [Flavobacteriales bacterium]MBT5699254.1 hypothetical protein [Flavobacteriales bacterium]MBT6815103.1 hypothetical protein [Flavobacteriales bacterium]MBT7620648.1 hypothetical protein [Flavobacteriales bacterium]MDG2059819.1 DUF5683 domain-containing protein [Flavobacteriales bacterium]